MTKTNSDYIGETIEQLDRMISEAREKAYTMSTPEEGAIAYSNIACRLLEAKCRLLGSN